MRIVEFGATTTTACGGGPLYTFPSAMQRRSMPLLCACAIETTVLVITSSEPPTSPAISAPEFRSGEISAVSPA